MTSAATPARGATMRDKERAGRAGGGHDRFFETLARYREEVLEELRALIPDNAYRGVLYDLMLEYPLREGKGFRPALCLATCQGCGGRLADAVPSAAALELFHNAFLIHDDLEDGSLNRRGSPTLHAKYGVGIAANVGDGMNVLALGTLLRNVEVIGLERALATVREAERMARESVEGQAIELDWIRHNRSDLGVRDYLTMCRKKTCWYTCIAPMRIGALIAGAPPERLDRFDAFGFHVGAAFQIQDDVLNLTAEEHLYGKEIGGDIAEGKRTVMVVHMLASARRRDRARLQRIFGKERDDKTPAELAFVRAAMDACGSIDFARALAHRLALRAEMLFERDLRWMPVSPHRRFLGEMIDYMITRRL
jgi:geranylgeranyl diphosphate synthase type II